MIRDDVLFTVPVLNRYDLLADLLKSVEDGTVRPGKILIVDNGGQLDEERARVLAGSERIEVIRPGTNLGVSKSWNQALRRGSPLTFISNDDIVFGRQSLERTVNAADASQGLAFFPGSFTGFCAFMLKRELVDAIGYFDESFWPAYYEDADYVRRIYVRGFEPVPVVDDDIKHVGGASRNLNEETKKYFESHDPAVRARFTEKWGSDPWAGVTRTYPSDLDREYERVQKTASDIHELVGVLHYWAKRVDRVTELGVRGGASTIALLCAQPAWMRCYDIIPCPVVERLRELCGRTDFRFEQADVLSIDLDETDLLFIDTKHTYDQLRAELARHSDKARRYIMMHDTTTFGARGEDGSKGLWPAIEEFLARDSFRLMEKWENNNGLTILERA